MSEYIEETAEDRRKADAAFRLFLGRFLFGAAVTIVTLAALGILYLAIGSAWQARARERQQQTEIAKVCIEQGNIWHKGDCLIAQKGNG
jgi:hypothetical protein